MRVLHVIPSVAPRYGGPSEAIVHLVRALESAGARALVATTDADGPGARLPVVLGREVDYRGAPTIFFARRGGEAAKVSPALASWLVRHVRGFDVVHIHAVLSFASIAAAAVAAALGVPYVVRPLGTLDPWSLSQKPLRKRVALSLGGRRLLRRAAAIHYTSLRERQATEGALGLGRGVVIPLGVDPELLAPVAPRPVDAPYLLALGRLHPVKNLPALIDAFARACASPRVPASARLVVAGEGPPELVAELEGRAAARGVAGRVELVGWVAGAEKRALLAGARALGMLSSHESFGISAVEALAVGVPVVVSDRLDLAADVGRVGCGWVVPSSEEERAAAIARALSEADEATRRGLAGAEWVRRELTWDRAAARLIELYEAVSRAREVPSG